MLKMTDLARWPIKEKGSLASIAGVGTASASTYTGGMPPVSNSGGIPDLSGFEGTRPTEVAMSKLNAIGAKTVRCIAVGLLSAIALMQVSAVEAAVIDLTFENLQTYPTTDYAFVQNAYNGGTDSQGFSGPNFGITFSDNAQVICLNTPDGSCSNTSRGGVGDPNSQKGGLFFLSGDQTFMNVNDGFTSGFSFNYSAISDPGSVSVFSGFDGTGSLLATLSIPTTMSGAPGTDCSGSGFCPFSPDGINFAGLAHSVSFAGSANQIVFDDVTFGSSTPGVVPLPSSLPMFGAALLALGAVGYGRKRRENSERLGVPRGCLSS